MVFRPNMVTGAGPPPSGTGYAGDHTVDGQGVLWFCIGPNWVPANAQAYNTGQVLTKGECSLPQVGVQGTGSITSQQALLTYFTAVKSEIVNNIGIKTNSVAAGATPTYCAMGLYLVNPDTSVSLLGACANDTTLFSSTFTTYTRALSNPVQKIAGQRYAWGMLVVSAAAMPSFFGESGNIVYNFPPVMTGVLTGQSVLPAFVAAGGLANTGNAFCGFVTP